MPTTKASQRAVHKYVKNNYDRIEITVPKGRKAELQAHAAKNRYNSLNDFVNKAIGNQVQNDMDAKKIIGMRGDGNA